jgi:hypothetical protein
MAAKAPAWNERDSKQVAQEGIAQQARTNWRKVTITSDPLNGDIVVEYGVLSGGSADVKRYSPTEFEKNAPKIARLIGWHVTP